MVNREPAVRRVEMVGSPGWRVDSRMVGRVGSLTVDRADSLGLVVRDQEGRAGRRGRAAWRVGRVARRALAARRVRVVRGRVAGAHRVIRAVGRGRAAGVAG